MQLLTTLRSKLRGNAFSQGDAGYGSAKRGKGTTPLHCRSPAIVVQVRVADDVAYAIEFARNNGIDFSIRSGGHDMLGASTSAGGVLIDLCHMNMVRLDPGSGRVRVEAGARSGLVTEAGRPFGLAPILGMSPSVGIGGLTLGGGIGWLSGTFGATVDHLVAAEIVTADGHSIGADAHHEPDLFWAIRGGGGNFGAAVAFTFQMQSVRDVLAGQLSLKTNPTKFLRFLNEYLAESADNLDVEVSFAPRGEVADVRLCWSGAPQAGEQALRSLRNFAPIVHDTVRTQNFSDFANEEPPVGNMFIRGGELAGLANGVADTVGEVLDNGPDGCSIGILHYMHGALCRPSADTPFVRPCGHVLYNVVAAWQGASSQLGKINWVTAAHQTLSRVSAPRTYINYLCDREDAAVRNAYGEHMEKLRAIKRKYDPDNTFVNNRNIVP